MKYLANIMNIYITPIKCNFQHEITNNLTNLDLTYIKLAWLGVTLLLHIGKMNSPHEECVVDKRCSWVVNPTLFSTY
jgi:hypothetical protein